MGAALSKKDCVDLSDLPAATYAELTSEDYTVIRTSGTQQTGWRIPTGAHLDCANQAACSIWAGALASNRILSTGHVLITGDPAQPWRVHMVFDGENSEHFCGWRVSDPARRTFWPTRLSGDAPEALAAREAWWLRLDGLLNSLQTYEQKEAKAAEAAKAAEDSDEEEFRTSEENWKIPKGFSGVDVGERLEAAYAADEPARHAAAKAAKAAEDSDEEEFRTSEENWKIPKGFSGVDVGERLEAAYAADEPARHAAAKALIEDPVATTGMMILMRQRESTMARCKRNGALSAMPPGKNFGSLLMDLQAVSEHDANRVRRLFDNGCPKAIIIHLCQILVSAPLRNQLITEEEAKLYLEPLAQPVHY